MSLGRVIRQLRKEQGKNQVDIARAIGTDSGNVSRIENDRQKPSVELLEKIAKALETSVAEIYRRVEHLGEPAAIGVNDEKYVMVPRLDLPVAAGNGFEPANVEVQGTLAFQREWLRKKGLDPTKLEIYDANGDSMAPYIRDGDILLVDLAKRTPQANEVWVLWQEPPLGVRVKRILYRENGDVIIRSDSADKSLYPDEIIPGHMADTLKTVGKVVWRGG